MAQIITIDTVRKIVGRFNSKQATNALSLVGAINDYGAKAGLDKPHRLAQFLPQALHESGAFTYDRELWGPTPQQKKYDTGPLAKKLGNTPEADGDGKKRAGRGPFQLTGGANEKNFTIWARKLDPNAPDFYKNPEKINTDPWEGLSAIWYWDIGNPEQKSLNHYADQGDIEMITKRINGGLNGYQDRLDWYAKTALVLLGYGPSDLRAFQKAAGLIPMDGIAGPKTRAALHKTLLAMTSKKDQGENARPAPVVIDKKVAVEVPVPVKNKELEKPWYKDLMGQKEVVTTVAVPSVTALSGAPWQTVGIIAVVCLIFGGAYYLIRRREIAKQEAQAQVIHANAVETKAAIQRI